MFVQIRKRNEEKIKCKDWDGIVQIIEQSWYKICKSSHKYQYISHFLRMYMCVLYLTMDVFFSLSLSFYMPIIIHRALHQKCISLFNLLFTAQSSMDYLHPALVSVVDLIALLFPQLDWVLHEIISSPTSVDETHISHSL